MAGLEGNEPNKQPQFFSVGSEVEVRSDEEGFKGAWFRAAIVTSPTNSASKKRKRALVEYKNLVTEDGSQQLKEYVDSAHLRPVPPSPPKVSGGQNFELGDVVDADYKDGWWIGVIGKVAENNSKYRVVFENPPDSIEFEKERLRLHQDWVSGQWVRPSKKEALVTSDYSLESEHVLHAHNNSNHLEVATQLENLGAAEDNPESTNSGKKLMERPSYHQSTKDKKLLAPNGSATDSRPLKILKDDKGVEATLSAHKLRKIPDNKAMLHELPKLTRGTRRSRKPVVSHQLFKTDSLLGEKNVKTKQENEGEVDNQLIHPIKSKGRRTKYPVENREAGKEENASVNSAGKIVQNEGISKEAEVPLTRGSKAKGKEGSAAESPCQLPNEDLLNRMRNQKKYTNDAAQEKSMELKQQQAGGSSNKRKRGRPRKLVVISPQASEGVKEQTGSGNVVDGNVAKDQTLEEVALHVLSRMDSTDSQDASRRKTVEFPGARCLTNEPARTCFGAPDNTDDDDRPLSMWLGGMQYPASVGESRPCSDRNVDQHSNRRAPIESARESSAVVAPSGSGLDEKQGLPFVKSSPVWETIETLEVFRLMPQNPHFHPLSNCKEEYREGLAIGNMITFSSLAKKISKLHFDDPRNVFDSIMESLLDLEKYGFNVTLLRGRVSELLSIKDRQGRFQVESKDAECKIVEHSHEKTKLVEESDNIAKKILELQERLALVKSEMEAKDLEIARLQMLVDAMNEGIECARSDFEKLAFAPLKLA